MGDPGAGGAQLHQLRQGHGILHQQCEIGAALQDLLQQPEHPVQRLVGLLHPPGHPQQQGQQPLQEPFAVVAQELVAAPAAQPVELPQDCLRIPVSGAAQRLQGWFALQLLAPQGAQLQPVAFGVAGLGGGEHLLEMLLNVAAMPLQPLPEPLPGGEPHAERQPQASLRVVRQLVGLLIGILLQAVLGAAQEVVCLHQLLHHILRQQLLLPQQLQHRQNGPLLQGRLPAAADQLKCLADELDFADAAGAQLYVVLHPLAAHFALDQALHAA